MIFCKCICKVALYCIELEYATYLNRQLTCDYLSLRINNKSLSHNQNTNWKLKGVKVCSLKHSSPEFGTYTPGISKRASNFFFLQTWQIHMYTEVIESSKRREKSVRASIVHLFLTTPLKNLSSFKAPR